VINWLEFSKLNLKKSWARKNEASLRCQGSWGILDHTSFQFIAQKFCFKIPWVFLPTKQIVSDESASGSSMSAASTSGLNHESLEKITDVFKSIERKIFLIFFSFHLEVKGKSWKIQENRFEVGGMNTVEATKIFSHFQDYLAFFDHNSSWWMLINIMEGDGMSSLGY
jgi:hypothetical protein